jgi:hypothetical protein
LSTFETQFHKIINLKPSKDAIGPESTDGSHNELNDRRNTEQETKLVKNRKKSIHGAHRAQGGIAVLGQKATDLPPA